MVETVADCCYLELHLNCDGAPRSDSKMYRKDMQLIHNSKKTLTFADKISNMYRFTKEEHNKLLRNAITSKYEKTNTKMKNKINKIGKKIGEKRSLKTKTTQQSE